MCCSVENGNIVHLKLMFIGKWKHSTFEIKKWKHSTSGIDVLLSEEQEVGHVFEIDVFSGKLKYI